MANVQINKRHKNATTDRSLIREEVSQIFRWLEVVWSLPPPDDFEPSENQATKKWKWMFIQSQGKHN